MARYVFLPILRKCSSGRREILPFLRKAASCLPCKRLCREMQPLLQLSALRRGLLHGLRRTGSEAAARAQAAATAGSAPPQPKPVPKPKPSPKFKNTKQLLFNILMAAAALLALLGVVVGALYVTGNLGYVTDFVHDLIHPETPDAPPNVPDGDLPNDDKQDDTLPNDDEQDDSLPNDGEQDDTLPNDDEQDDSLPNDDEQDDTLPDDVAPTPPPIDTLSAEEFEAAITHIRELYNEIESNRQAGTYDAYDPENGVVYYFSDDDLIAITTQPNVENNAYRRFYYYQDGVLFFAYYEGQRQLPLLLLSGAV